MSTTVMFLAAAGCVVFILFISGVEGKPNIICALKGSLVNLSCSAPHSAANFNWYKKSIYNRGDYEEVTADGNPFKFNISEDGLNLTIRDLTESDENLYCCSEITPNQKPDPTDSCQQSSIQLQVTELQVKVFPASEGQKVTLMCTSSCSLTESPAAFIWYQNSEFLYEDWSPWYQELLSSDQAVRYSCGVRGYQDLRAPDVSVDSVSWSCFSVTYAGGRMCSYRQTAEKQPCSLTFPTDVHVEKKHLTGGNFRLSCNSSCPLTDLQSTFQLYRNTQTDSEIVDKSTTVTISSPDSYYCAVKDRHDLLSDEVCVDGSGCWRVNYESRRICALKASSVNISSKYSHPENQPPQTKLWYKVEIHARQEKELMEDGDVLFQDEGENQHILRLNHLEKKNSGEYRFRMKGGYDELIMSVYPGVTLIVTELVVDVRPAADVTEGQRVTLTCSTSCPLSGNTNYIWYLNSQPLSGTQTANKQLILDAVSSQDGGNYSCTVDRISSDGRTVTVQRRPTEDGIPAAAGLAAAGVCAVLLVLVPLGVFLYRKHKTSNRSTRTEYVHNADEVNTGHTYEEIAAQPAETELHYSQLALEKRNPLYSSIHSLQDQEHVPYAVVRAGADSHSD